MPPLKPLFVTGRADDPQIGEPLENVRAELDDPFGVASKFAGDLDQAHPRRGGMPENLEQAHRHLVGRHEPHPLRRVRYPISQVASSGGATGCKSGPILSTGKR